MKLLNNENHRPSAGQMVKWRTNGHWCIGKVDYVIYSAGSEESAVFIKLPAEPYTLITAAGYVPLWAVIPCAQEEWDGIEEGFRHYTPDEWKSFTEANFRRSPYAKVREPGPIFLFDKNDDGLYRWSEVGVYEDALALQIKNQVP